MDTVTHLNAAVTMLTRRHPMGVIDPDGRTRWITAEPLLIQLLMAVKNTTAGTAFKSGAVHPPLPLSAEAMDLLARIDDEATEHWWALYRHHFGEGRGTLGGRIRAWAIAAQAEPTALRDADRIMNGWVQDIRHLLEPVRSMDIKGKCPACGNDRYRRIDQFGDSVLEHALYVEYFEGNPTEGVCRACGERWHWSALAQEMGVNDDTVSDGDMPAV